MRRELFAVAVLVAACTRDNPEFGDERGTGSGKDDDGTDPSADDDEDSVDDDEGVDDDDGADTLNDDEGPSSGVVDDGVETGPSTSGGLVCEVFPPEAFDVKLMDAAGDIDPMCGELQTWSGPVLTVEGNSFTISVCPDDTCECAGVPTTFLFEDLLPSPADAAANEPKACVRLRVARFPDGEGCGVDWLTLDSLSTPSDYPIYLAASSDAPGWDYTATVPTPVLVDPLDVCDVALCEMPPGDWTMGFGDLVLAPGEYGFFDMSPYAGAEVPYGVANLYSRLDVECHGWLGWAAVYEG